jgi:carbon monoxide dehydrogenase subunit G
MGFLRGDGLLQLSPATVGALSAAPSERHSTVVSYEGEAQVGGTMAAVGQRLIDGTAKMMVKKFFDKLASLATDSRDS